MTDLPELRVSDADRDRIALALRDACAEGRLTLDELAARVGDAYASKTAAELEAVTRDLPPAPLERRKHRRAKWLSGVLFGHIVRKGRWRVPRFGLVLVGFGDADIDLRHAELHSKAVTLTALVAFGNVDFYVPEGIEVDLGGLAVVGHRREWGEDLPPRAGTPFVRIRVVSLFGTSDVWRIPAGASGNYGELIRAVRRRRELNP
jgi:Domain of unknown function (DUF1707)